MRKYIVRYKAGLFAGRYRTKEGVATHDRSKAEEFTVEEAILHRSLNAELRSGMVEIVHA